MKQKDLILKIVLRLLTVIILYVLSFCVFKKSMNNYSQEYIFYKEESKVDYKVYLKDNDFFEQSYLEKDKLYIASLIKNITADYDYSINFDSPMSGTYKYTVKAVMSADREKGSTSNYWQKEYRIFESEEIPYKDLNYVTFKTEPLQVNYDYYNDILVKFKKEYNLSIYGNLKLIIEVTNNAVSKSNNEYKIDTVSTLDIPLTQATVEIPIKTDAANKTASLESSLMIEENPLYIILKVVSGICFLLGTLILSRFIILLVREAEKPSSYDKTIKKILKTYSEIIVNANSLDINGLNIVEVKDFNELMDAYSEVRQPINFQEKRGGATFVLIHDKMAWVYNIKKGMFYEKVR